MLPPDALRILSGLLEISRWGIIAQDAAGRVHVWSCGAERIFGWSEQEMLQRPVPAALQLLQGTSPETAVSLPRKDGTLVSVETKSTIWKDAEGNEKGTIFVVTEAGRHGVTQQKLAHAEQDLLEMTVREQDGRAEMQIERRFRNLLEAAPDAIIEVDSEGRIVLLNLATERSFGYSREELQNQPVEILVPEALESRHRQHRADYWNQPVTRPMGVGLTLLGRRKDGSFFPVEISLSPVKSADGFRVTAIIRDVTERQQAQTRFRELQQVYMQELESRNREVERANRLKSEFLASMSHELRTPLHTIIGFSELLAEEIEGPLNPKQQRFMNHIHQDSLHLLELINDILDISKIEAGRLGLHREVFDIASSLDDVLASLRPQATAKSIHIDTNLAIPKTVSADPLRVKQIFFNLLSNALKFTPEGGSIHVQSTLRDGFLETSVSDTGVGVAKEYHDAIFDKFYQIGATTKGVREGTGLGLAITKALVEEHGGHIWLESEPGAGSRFTFTISI